MDLVFSWMEKRLKNAEKFTMPKNIVLKYKKNNKKVILMLFFYFFLFIVFVRKRKIVKKVFKDALKYLLK